ncbi:MAG: FixH family protein [Myxococcota bacterium]
MPKIPARIFYPGMVIALLTLSVGFVVTTVVAAYSDGGPQVVENYYQKSVDYDETQALRSAAESTDWRIEVENMAQAGGGEPLLVDIVDAKGRPVTGLQGTLELRRPELAAAVGSSQLTPVDGQPGRYAAGVAPGRKGLWDIQLKVEKGSATYLFEKREELR